MELDPRRQAQRLLDQSISQTDQLWLEVEHWYATRRFRTPNGIERILRILDTKNPEALRCMDDETVTFIMTLAVVALSEIVNRTAARLLETRNDAPA